MPITDLTNTKWVLKNTMWNYVPSSDSFWEFYVNFVSNSNSFSSMYIEDQEDIGGSISYGSSRVYYGRGNSWANQAYRIISITGGDDATDANLISWLQANATQVEVDDLSGTIWEIDNTYIDTPWEDIIYNINFTSNSENFTKFNLSGEADSDVWVIFYGSTQVSWYNPYENPPDFGWYNDNYRTIQITDGTDATNPDLIIWLAANGTLTAPAPQPTIVTKRLNWGNITLDIHHK